jgi:mRNA interferase RelE/StbE
VSSYRVALTASTEKELHRLPTKMVARIMPRLEHLALAPRPPGCKKLRGGDQEWRIRIGDYRIVYVIERHGQNRRCDANRAPTRCV